MRAFKKILDKRIPFNIQIKRKPFNIWTKDTYLISDKRFLIFGLQNLRTLELSSIPNNLVVFTHSIIVCYFASPRILFCTLEYLSFVYHTSCITPLFNKQIKGSQLNTFCPYAMLHCYIGQFQVTVFSRFCYVLLCNHEYIHCLNHRQAKDYITRGNETERKL